MSKMPPTLEHRTLDMSLDTPRSNFQPIKSQRVLACVLCQQRKIKCKIRLPSHHPSTTIHSSIPDMLPQAHANFPARIASSPVPNVCRPLNANEDVGSPSEPCWNVFANMRTCSVKIISSSKHPTRIPRERKRLSMRRVAIIPMMSILSLYGPLCQLHRSPSSPKQLMRPSKRCTGS